MNTIYTHTILHITHTLPIDGGEHQYRERGEEQVEELYGDLEIVLLATPTIACIVYSMNNM